MWLFDKFRRIRAPEDHREILDQGGLEHPDESGEEAPYGKLLDISTSDKENRVAFLTPREYQIYLLLLQGFTLKECAKQLCIQYSTANTHMNGVYRKLGINTRAGLIINYRDILMTDGRGP